jgi:hypothetical protein
VHGQATQEALFSCFLRTFENPAPEVVSKLASPTVYSFFQASHVARALPAFMRLVSELTNWRDVQGCVQTWMAFPPEIVRRNWRVFVDVAFPLFCQSPQPLTACGQGLCARLSIVLKLDHRIEFCERVIAAFFRSTDWQVRRLFVVVSAAMVVPNQAANVVGHMLPPIFSLAEDPVAAVRVAVLRAATRLRTFFQDVGDDQRHQEVLSMFMTMDHTQDQFIDDIWRECSDKMGVKLALSSLPILQSCGSSSGTRPLGDAQRRHSLRNQGPKLVVERGVTIHRGKATLIKPRMRT